MFFVLFDHSYSSAAGRRGAAIPVTTAGFKPGPPISTPSSSNMRWRRPPFESTIIFFLPGNTCSIVSRYSRVPFGPGDVLFVPAGTVHRFEDFSADFATWIVFYGPEGGEPE